MTKNLKQCVYFVSKITCSVLSCFVTTRIAAVLKMVGELKVRLLVISLILPVFHQIDPPGENIKHHLFIDRKNKWPVKARSSSVWKLNLTELTEKYPKYSFAWFLSFLFSFLIQNLLRYRIFKWKVIFKVIVLLLLIENLAFWGKRITATISLPEIMERRFHTMNFQWLDSGISCRTCELEFIQH